MLAIQVRLLTGRYVATQFDDRDRAEWPPHPARLFSAAVAAWADVDDPDPDERAALTWWESLGAPTIACSPSEDTATRSVVTHYVPVNDVNGVLSRDPAAAYEELGSALDLQATALADPDPRLAARNLKKASSAVQKAHRKVAAYASGGTAPSSAVGVFPESRTRQARTYPSTTPPDELVSFTWPEATIDVQHIDALDRVLSRIGRLGHSSTLVDVALVADVEVTPTYEPGEPATMALRTAGTGQLDALVAAFESHQGSDLRSLPAAMTGYREHQPQTSSPGSRFDRHRWLLFDLNPRRGLRDALLLTRALRDTLMSYAEQPPPPMISGHRRSIDGAPTAPTTDWHAAFVALPYVGSRYADGGIHGLGVILPADVSEEDRRAVVTAARRWQDEGSGSLVLGRRGAFTAKPLKPEDASVTVRPDTWTRAATRWSSAFPVALDRHPGPLESPNPAKRERAFAEAEESVMSACQNIGLPTPASVSIRFDAPIRGTRPVSAFGPFTVGAKRLRRMLVHVDLTFDEPVQGPIILGSGRFFGYGLCWPHPEVAG